MTPWAEIAAVIALGVGANTENLPVGFAYGLRRLRIGLVRNLLIAAVTTAAALVPLSIGRGLRDYVPLAASPAWPMARLASRSPASAWRCCGWASG